MKRNGLVLLMIILSAVACKSSSKVISNEQAYQMVQGIPEVQEYVAELVRDHAKPYMRLESESDDPFYEFYVGSDQPTHTVVWKRFRVDRKSGVATVYDNKADEYVTLEEWRERIKTGVMTK